MGAPFHHNTFASEPGLAERRSFGILTQMGIDPTPVCIEAMSTALYEIDPNHLDVGRPVLLIYGEQEGNNPNLARDFADRNPVHEAVVIKGVGHYLGVFPSFLGYSFVMPEPVKQVRKTIKSWINRMEGRTYFGIE